MREQLTVFKNEYVFYKKESEMLSMRLRDETEGLSLQIRAHQELEKDFRLRLAELERENQELQQYTRQLQVELNAQSRNVKQIMGANDQF